MRHETLTLYKFYELNEEAQDRAIKEVGPVITEDANDVECYEYSAALKEIEKAFGIGVDDYTVGSYGRCDFDFHFTEGRLVNWDWDDLTNADNPSLLLRYYNLVDDRCREHSFYAKTFKKGEKYDCKSRYSKILCVPYSYMLTGTWCTEAVDDVMNDFWQFYKRGFTVREFVSEILERFFAQWQADLEYQETREFIVDEIDSQEMEFLADGRRYC